MSPMWPMLLDLTKDECKRILRRLELEAYASMVSAFRAQGELSKDKKKILQELCTILGISTERHRAEIRRAVNDEKLATIADLVGGCSTYSEWAIEGRRLVPLMPRLVPQTAFTNIANNAALLAAQHNASLPPPSATAAVIKNENLSSFVGNSIKGVGKASVEITETSTVLPNVTPAAPKADSVPLSSPVASSQSNVLMLPSGVSFQVKPTNHDRVQTDVKSRKRKHSTSTDLQPPFQQKLSFSSSSGNVTPIVIKNTVAPSTMLSTSATSKTVSIPIGGTPVQFTLTSSAPKSATSSSPSTIPTQKVILVSTSCSNLQSSILQRSLSVPIVKTVTTTGTMASVTQSLGKASSLITPISSLSPGSLAIPSGSMTSVGSAATPTSQAASSGLKVIAQTVPVTGGSKFVPKSSAGGGIPPIVVVTKTGAVTGNQSGTRLVNVLGTQASASRFLSPSSLSVAKSPSTLVTVGPNGKQATLLKVPSGMSISSAGGRPNVIVVQKAHVLQQAQSGNAFTISASALSGSHTMLKSGTLSSAKDSGSRHAIIIPKTRAATVTLASSSDLASDNDVTQVAKKSTVLADLLQAAGIIPDSSSLEPAQQADLLAACFEESKPEEKRNDSVPSLSSVVQSLRSKEAVNLFNHPVFESSTDTAKSKKCESGELDPKTGLFGPCPRHSSSEGFDPDETCVAVDRSRDVLLENVLTDAKKPSDSYCAVTIEENVSALRRELLAGRGDDKKRDGTKQAELNVFPNALDLNESIGTKESLLQPGRTYLYTGATYSKGDVAIRRKKTFSATKIGSPTKHSAPSALEVSIPNEIEDCRTLQQTILEQFVIEKEAPEIGACDEIQFTDESLTAVIEETVVTTEEDATAGEVVEDDFDIPLDDEVGFEICQQPDGGLESIEVIGEDVDDIVAQESAVSFAAMQNLSNNNASYSDAQSGSSVFMVRDSTSTQITSQPDYGPQEQDELSVDHGIHSTFINQEGVCEITSFEGASDMLEIIGCTDDFDSVESKVAALHGGCGEDEILGLTAGPIATKKRRKSGSNVVAEDAPTTVPHLHGWSRAATGLLLRVMKFRGVGRMKGEPSAAHWFLQPVTAEEAPGYHQVVKHPMDLSTIKNKLERFVYKDVSEFHDDMMLIKSNCELYNPPEHPARQDCKEVFAFFQVEYDRILEKWQKAHLFSSPQKKRLT